MAQEKDLIINNWTTGIAPSSYLGPELVLGCDIYARPGALLANPKSVKDSSTTIDDTPNWIVRDGDDVWCTTDNGKIYKRASGTWSHVSGNTVGGGQGLAIWKDYLMDIRGNTINTYGPLSGTPAWNNTWKTIQVGTWHASLKAQDDVLYIGSNGYLLSITEVDGQTFDPTSGATYTAKLQSTDAALDLPDGYKIIGITELGKNLMIAANNADTNQADIFPWDRTSASYNLPIRFGYETIRAMITVNNLIYVIGGREGTIYVTDGTTVKRITKLPNKLAVPPNALSTGVTVDPGSIAYFKSRIHFGTRNLGTAGSIAGIWALDPDDGRLTLEYTSSTGNYDVSNISMGAIMPFDEDQLMFGYKDVTDSSIGIDLTSSSSVNDDNNAIFISQFYRVGTNLNKKTFSTLELTLANSLTTNEEVSIYYRKEEDDAWVLIQTFDDSLDNFHISFGLSDLVNIQFKITFSGTGTSSPEILELRLR